MNFTLSPRGPSPPGDPLLQRTFSRLAAIHLVPQGTLSSRGPSLAAQFKLSVEFTNSEVLH